MLNVNDLADAINTAIGQTLSPTPEMMTFASAVISTLMAGSVANAPGTVTGSAPPTSPMVGGTASSGLMTLSQSIWYSTMQSGFPTSNPAQLNSEATASTTYLMASGQVTFLPGQITGNCTATPASPGPLVGGAGVGGLIGLLVGPTWATQVLAALATVGPLAIPIYTAISTYIMANSLVAYPPNSINGNFAPGGGPLLLGTGAGGAIS